MPPRLMCQPNKFLEGWMVFLPRLEACAFIGRCRASKEAGDAADADWRQREE